MKRLAVPGALLLFVTIAMSGAGDVWQQLKVPKNEVNQELARSFASGSVDIYRFKRGYLAAAPELRTAMVEQVLTFAKAYVNSPQFAKDYAALREEAKPQVEEEEQKSVDEILAERQAQRKADLEETKKSIAAMPAEYRKQAEEGYKAAVEAMKQLDTPEFRKMERQGIEMELQGRKESENSDLADWKENYPENPKEVVKRRLREFLEATEGIDYDAQLTKKYGKMVFVNREYESKPSDWKMAFRAGKEPTEKARAFAKAWLAELK
jgi:hypothetical protein